MKSITIIEDGDESRSLYVQANGRVDVHNRHRFIKLRVDLTGAESTWQILARVAPHVAAAEAVTIKIEHLAVRCRGGWTPLADEIGADVP